MTGLCDAWQRQINYLRISVTDHCNFRCVYCSGGDFARLPHSEILSYEEIERLVRVAAGLGINKVRLTGGEPLLRPDLVKLVALLARVPGLDDISLTTNGSLLSRYALELKAVGLKRVNVSLDTLRADRFARLTGAGKLEDVLRGIASANDAGLRPVKVNMVVLRGINDDEVPDFARLSLEEGWHIRFIEFMPLTRQAFQTVPAREIAARLGSLGELVPFSGKSGDGPARYYQIAGGRGTIGFITPVSEHFCQSCNRLRLTADGRLRPCLLDDAEVNIKRALRGGASTQELAALLERAAASKQPNHHLAEGRAPGRPMRQIGG